MADGLNNSWLIILGVTGGLMTGASGMIFSIANKYNRAIKQVKKQESANNVVDQMQEGSSNSEYRMVTGMLLSRDPTRQKEESKNLQAFANQITRANKCKVLFSSETYCQYGTNKLDETGQSSFKNGDFSLVDVKNPTSKNQIRIDAQSGQYLFGASINNKRQDFFKNNTLCERIKHLGVESFTLTMVGKITYDFQKDEFSMNEPLAMIGGGMQDVVNYMQQRYFYMSELASTLMWCGAIFLSIASFTLYCRFQARRTRQRVEAANEALNLRQPQLERSMSQKETGAVECIVCMSAIANVVLAPCNHLTICQQCYKDMVTRNGNQNITCPLCRVEVDYEEVFYVSKLH